MRFHKIFRRGTLCDKNIKEEPTDTLIFVIKLKRS